MATASFVAAIVAAPGSADAAAGTPPQAAPAVVARDSAGIEIVENRAPAWSAGRGWTVDAEPVLQIGAMDGGRPYLFERIPQALMLPEGGVAVVESGAAEIRLFDTTGTWIRTIGRRGEGPGEFSAPPRIALASPDTLVAWDAGTRRLSRFLLDGTLLAEGRMRANVGGMSLSMGGGGMPWRVLPTGELLAVGGRWSFVEGGGPTARITDLRYALALVLDLGGHVVPLGEHPASRRIAGEGGNAWDPFSPTTGMTLDGPPPTLTLVDSPRWELREISMDGRTRRIVLIARARPAVTDELLERHRAWIRARGREAGDDPAADLRAFGLLAAPDSAPAVAALHSDGRGTRFLQRWQHVGNASPSTLEVIDRDGRWLGSLDMPADAGRIVGIDEAHILTEWRNELDVPFVRVYRLRKGGA